VPENTVHIQLEAMNELNVLSEADMNLKSNEKAEEDAEVDQNIE
jgi:hypothetical protein